MVQEAQKAIPAGSLLPDEVLAEIQAKITEYDRQYQFGEKKAPKSRMGDIEEEALDIARSQVEARLRQQYGVEPNPEEPEFRNAVETTAQLPSVLAEARQRVAAKRAAMSGSLLDL